MPILKSSKKALRSSKKKGSLNSAVREKYKEALIKARRNPTGANLSLAVKLLDKAAKINVIHKNKAARLKSRLAKLANKKEVKEEKPIKKSVKKTPAKKSSQTVAKAKKANPKEK
ncbi:MAG: 30S ribosomal protein S20 [Microgenomates group bacterium ADurb.Bin219]|nr:MAG: 30S ribosomal protein S20 [Microgenomates group bacterium ADurb.Bin219]HNP89252.1 30S ribosomal protein S20 [Candidatus Woesebacteria bacterium]